MIAANLQNQLNNNNASSTPPDGDGNPGMGTM